MQPSLARAASQLRPHAIGLFSFLLGLPALPDPCLAASWVTGVLLSFASTPQTSYALVVDLGLYGCRIHSPRGQSLCPFLSSNSSLSRPSAGMGLPLLLSLDLDLWSRLTYAFPWQNPEALIHSRDTVSWILKALPLCLSLLDAILPFRLL